ncbi:hypothetical protein Tdes44962_MAKER10402 [Teratosphaeria destructans]|uniref:Uncharacterized protein n=1 Tax=Teratosphaeria destructans TaxID=418781 RepID=A0A9W7SIR9_9PEZI|nr:hypothetical protein Tdes44962_MAKER10402 [Teratosphaeria destructans]
MPADVAAAGPAAAVQDDAEDDEADDGQDLDDGEEELGLAVALDAEEVDDDDEHEEDGDPGVVVDAAVRPVVDGEGGRDDLQREHDEPLQGVAGVSRSARQRSGRGAGGVIGDLLPAHGEAPGGIQEAGRVGGEGAGDGEQDGHLAQGVDGAVHHDADEDEGDEEGGGPALGQGAAAADEQAGADAAADGDHLQVTALEVGELAVASAALDVEDAAVGADGALGGGVGIGVALEAVDEARGPGGAVFLVMAIFGGEGGGAFGRVVQVHVFLMVRHVRSS